MRRLPALRGDLRRFAGAPDRDGSPVTVIEDPVSNRFFRIGWLDSALLDHWGLGDPRRVAQAVARQTGSVPTAAELAALQQFLREHELLQADRDDDVDELLRKASRGRASALHGLLHHYLFFRIPLIRPARMLRALLPWLQWLWHPVFHWLAAVATALGLLLAAQRWDEVRATAIDWLTPGGLAAALLALAFAKAVHELGHALTATRLGVRVGHMGVAFMVLWPMLYTDTGQSWRLVDRRQRFAIAAAGIRAELLLAGFATLGWALLDDGPLRQALFVLATTSWVLTLAINISPFMRFDGYFLLSDWLDLPNLHGRSFALARAWLRRVLLGWHEPDPEPFRPGLRRGLIVFALLTWLYRLVLFIGIALAVYHLFFKALGLLLLAVELIWFIGRPVAAELTVWHRGRQRTQRGYAARSLLLLLAVLCGLALPWPGQVAASGWLHAERSQAVHAPLAARIVRLAVPGPVTAGTELLALAEPETEQRARQAQLAIGSLERQIRQTAGLAEGAVERLALLEQRVARQADLAAESADLARLQVTAAFAGEAVDIDPGLRPGSWVNPGQVLMVLVDPHHWIVDALVPQDAIDRLTVGAVARFRPWRGHGSALTGTVVDIDQDRLGRLPHPLFDAERGGRLATRGGPEATRTGAPGREPRDGFYRIRIRVPAPGQLREMAGQVLIEAESRSLLAQWGRGLVAVWIRESGF